MRPIFFGATLDPPVMDVLIPAESLDESYRIVRGVKIKASVSSLEEALHAGLQEVRAFTPHQIELLREIAVPISREAIVAMDGPPMLAVDAVQQVAFNGLVFCPACCRKLGAGDSPALGYITVCPGCQRSLRIDRTESHLIVVVGAPKGDPRST